MHPQKLLPRGKRAGNCLIGRLCPSAVSRMGEVTLFMQGDPARQEGCLGVLREHWSILKLFRVQEMAVGTSRLLHKKDYRN